MPYGHLLPCVHLFAVEITEGRELALSPLGKPAMQPFFVPICHEGSKKALCYGG